MFPGALKAGVVGGCRAACYNRRGYPIQCSSPSSIPAPMTLRAPFVAILMLACGPASATLPGPRAAPSEAPPPIVFYVAKGGPDACGSGCDSWIAVEGQIDSAAASRFRKFLRQVKGRDLPIYFSSPGGNLDQAVAMGAMLRERHVVARVARTVVWECGFEAQDGDVCLKLKQSGRGIHADLWTRGAMCNSACPYLILGATTREIAPDTVLAVHSPKVVLQFSGLAPTAEMRAAATERGIERGNRLLSSYFARMGADPGLLDLARTVKFESLHVLTRDEIIRFGIDRRKFVETPWTLETAIRPYIRKIALAKKDDGASSRTMEWRLFCENRNRARLMFIRELDKGAPGFHSVIVMAGSEKPVTFGTFPARAGTFEAWSGTITSDAMKAVLAVSHLQVGEGTLKPDGKVDQDIFDIDTSGLGPAWTQLSASCPAAPNNERSAIASPGPAAAPAR
jgi:hypothetical protein